MDIIGMKKIEDGRYILASDGLDLSEIYFDDKLPIKDDFFYFINSYPKTIQKKKHFTLEVSYVLLDHTNTVFPLPKTISGEDMTKIKDIVPDLNYSYCCKFSNCEDIEVLVVELTRNDSECWEVKNMKYFKKQGEQL